MGLTRRFFPETVLKQDTLSLYNPKEYRGEKKICPFFLPENSRPLSPWGPLDFLSTCLGIDSLNTMNSKAILGVIDQMKILSSLINADDIHKSSRVGCIGAEFAFDLNEMLHANLLHFISC